MFDCIIMLQMKQAALKALENLRSAGEIPFVWQSMEELERKTNDSSSYRSAYRFADC